MRKGNFTLSKAPMFVTNYLHIHPLQPTLRHEAAPRCRLRRPGRLRRGAGLPVLGRLPGGAGGRTRAGLQLRGAPLRLLRRRAQRVPRVPRVRAPR